MFIKTLKQCLPYLFKAHIAPMVQGPHGIGKSQAVKQYCDENGMQFIDLRLGNMEVGDLLGLADFQKDAKGNNVATKFMRPSWLPTDPDSKGIIFLDEVNRARRDCLQAIFQFVLDRKIHEYTLPEGWHIVSAINPATEDYIVTDISDKALMSRFCHIRLTPSAAEWFEHATDSGYKMDVVNFLKEQPDLLQAQTQDFNFDDIKPNRRAWDMISRLMTAETPENLLQELSFGLVGQAATIAFMEYLNNSDKPFTAEDILKHFGKAEERIKKYSDHEIGGRLDLLKVSGENVLKYVKDKADKLTKTEEKNLINFLKTVPVDLSFSLSRELFLVESVREILANNDTLKEIYKKAKKTTDKTEEVK